MHAKDGLANSVDPDTDCSCSFRSSVIWVYTVCPDLSVWKLRIITGRISWSLLAVTGGLQIFWNLQSWKTADLVWFEFVHDTYWKMQHPSCPLAPAIPYAPWHRPSLTPPSTGHPSCPLAPAILHAPWHRPSFMPPGTGRPACPLALAIPHGPWHQPFLRPPGTGHPSCPLALA